MPRVNLYRGNAVQREGTTAAKFVPADFSRSPLGEGLQRAGQALGEYAEREDQIQALYDEQDAQRLDLEHVKQTQALSDRLRQVRGAGAREAADGLAGELERYNADLLGRARSPRARMMLENVIARRSAGEVERYHTYADGEFVQDFRATNDAAITASVERATDIGDQDQSRAALEADTFRLIDERARFEGWEGGAGGAQATAYRLRATNAYHLSRARQIARQDAAQAMDYAIQHRGEMTDESVNGILDSLNSEALDQWAEAEVDGANVLPDQPANDDQPPGPAPSPRQEAPIAMPGQVTSGFGHRERPAANASSNHAGIDSAMPVGTDVPTMLSGRVTFAGPRGNYGNLVIVDHGGGLESRYAHLSRIGVRVNQNVTRGEVIAASGGARGAAGSGNSTGPHLHYELRRDGRPVDPRSVTTARVQPGGTRPVNVAPGADMEAQIAAIRDNDSYSFRQQQALIAVVRRRHGEQRQARAEREDEADRSAAATAAQLGEGFTSMSQLPNGGADLSPRDRLSYSNMARGNRERAESEPPSPDLMLWINYQRFANPGFYASEQFLQQARQHGASAAMLRNIAADQGQILGTRIPADRAHIWSIAEPILVAAGINLDTLQTSGSERNREASAAERQEDARRKNAILSNLEQLHNIWVAAHPGQPPTDETIRAWVSRAAVNTSDQARTPFSLLELDDAQLHARLSPRDLAAAERALRSANIPINDRTIAMAVRQRIAQRLP